LLKKGCVHSTGLKMASSSAPCSLRGKSSKISTSSVWRRRRKRLGCCSTQAQMRPQRGVSTLFSLRYLRSIEHRWSLLVLRLRSSVILIVKLLTKEEKVTMAKSTISTV